VVIVLYLPEDPTPQSEKYPYKVKYYKDIVNDNPLYYLGEEEGATEFEELYQLLVGDVAEDLGSAWRNLKRPTGYGGGAVQNGYPVITVDVEKNVIIVLYLPENPPRSGDTSGSDGSSGAVAPPGTTILPGTTTIPETTVLPETDTPLGATNPPDETESRDDSNIPPVSNIPGRELVPDGDGFIEFDEEGVPLGRWMWDLDEERWIFDEFPPLARIPQTGGGKPQSFAFLLLGYSLVGLGVLIVRGKPYRPKRLKSHVK